MAATPVQFRELATLDLESASGYYVAEADVATAIRFVDAVEAGRLSALVIVRGSRRARMNRTDA